MKTPFLKINDRAFDNLLRAQIGRPSGSPSACPEFDPDLANAYVEHSLTPAMHTRYERHLSDCAGCRTGVVALARMAAADSSPLQIPGKTAPGSESPGWFASIRSGFSVLASPRWAAATAGLIIIAFSLPVLLWQNGRRTSEGEPAASQVAQSQPEPAAPADSLSAGYFQKERSNRLEPEKEGERSRQTKTAVARPNAEGELQGLIAQAPMKADSNEHQNRQASQTASEPSEKKAEVRDAAAGADETKSKARADQQAAGAPAAAPVTGERAEESRALSKINKEAALKLPADDKRAVSVTGLRPGVIDASPKTERERAGTITPKDAEAPKTKGGEGVVHGTVARRQSGRALLDADTAPASRARSPQKKVGKKTFLLSKGIWTDSDFDPTDNLPIVTVVRSSDVYKEMLEKNNKLKSFLTGFGDGERAIIVYKSTVYKLIPQSDSK